MSKLSEKFAAGKRSLAERQVGLGLPLDPSPPSPSLRSTGPTHGSVSTMKIDLLKAEVAALKAGKPVLMIPAKSIKPSIWANRHGDAFDGPQFTAFKAEIESSGGNVQPIKVRRVSDELGEERFEVVFGHRRHRACLELGLMVSAFVDDVDDKTLFIEMERENRQRADLRPYEQGVMYIRALDNGIFPSLRKLAEEVGVDVGNASKAVSLARLPVPVLECFASRLDIQFRWASELKVALEKEHDVVLARANGIRKQLAGGNPISSQAAFDLLVGKGSPKSKVPNREIKVGGKVLVVSQTTKKVTYEIDRLASDKLDKIEKFISSVLSE
jgi:ParB family chromosome partitioning protein